MAVLSELAAKAGGKNVRTYIQSGNVVFEAGVADASGICAAVSKAIKTGLKLDVPVVTRSAAELAKVVKGNPFLKPGADPARLHVAFLADRPAAGNVARLDPRRSPPDTFMVKGREIYLATPNGLGKSKLTNAWFDATLNTVGTIRNWNTVLTLLAMAEGKEPRT